MVETDASMRMHLQCIKVCGISLDYFNEIPTDQVRRDAPHDWNWWHQKCDQDKVLTYTARYSYDPRIITASDPKKVQQIDTLVTDLLKVARMRNIH